MEHSKDINTSILEGVKVKRLELNYQFKPFDCGVEQLNTFLIEDSITHLQNLENVTYILESDTEIIAYYTLSNDRLIIRDIEDFREEIGDDCIAECYREGFFEQCDYPAVKLSFLAVNSKYQSNGIGKFIIESLKWGFIENNKTGCQFITINALNNSKTIRFYEREGFTLLTASDYNKEWRSMYYCLLKHSRFIED